MKVVVAAGGRFHALALAHQLEKRGYLRKLFTSSYSKDQKKYISPQLVSNYDFVKHLDYFFAKFRFSKFINKSSYYVFKDNLFDYWLNRHIRKIDKIDVFVGWTNFFLKSLPQIRKTGAKIIAESGSCHILEQQEILHEEYSRFGIKFPSVDKNNISKMIEEYDKSDYIMTISDFAYKSFLKHGISSSKLLKVSCGVDVEYFYSQDDLRKNDKKFRIICVGLLGLRKGIQYLLEAWNKLNLPEKDSQLVLVGNMQKDLAVALKKIKVAKNVIFHGATDRKDLAKLYKNSSLFVLPSIEDGFGMVIGEAMASGLPVICSTNTAAKDLIEDGKHGFIFKSRDVDSLAEKILWVYQNQEESLQMGKIGKERIKLFTWDNYGKNVIKAYKDVLAKKA